MAPRSKRAAAAAATSKIKKVVVDIINQDDEDYEGDPKKRTISPHRQWKRLSHDSLSFDNAVTSNPEGGHVGRESQKRTISTYDTSKPYNDDCLSFDGDSSSSASSKKFKSSREGSWILEDELGSSGDSDTAMSYGSLFSKSTYDSVPTSIGSTSSSGYLSPIYFCASNSVTASVKARIAHQQRRAVRQVHSDRKMVLSRSTRQRMSLPSSSTGAPSPNYSPIYASRLSFTPIAHLPTTPRLDDRIHYRIIRKA